MDHLQLDIITQEKPTFSGTVEAITAPASEGEVTILPKHIPLFTKLAPGEVKILQKDRWTNLAVAGGFMDVAPGSQVTILADSAVRIEEINVAKAEEAKQKAEARLKEQKLSKREFALATADLRRAVLELHVARKYRRRSQLPGE